MLIFVTRKLFTFGVLAKDLGIVLEPLGVVTLNDGWGVAKRLVERSVDSLLSTDGKLCTFREESCIEAFASGIPCVDTRPAANLSSALRKQKYQ